MAITPDRKLLAAAGESLPTVYLMKYISPFITLVYFFFCYSLFFLSFVLLNDSLKKFCLGQYLLIIIYLIFRISAY